MSFKPRDFILSLNICLCATSKYNIDNRKTLSLFTLPLGSLADLSTQKEAIVSDNSLLC